MFARLQQIISVLAARFSSRLCQHLNVVNKEAATAKILPPTKDLEANSAIAVWDVVLIKGYSKLNFRVPNGNARDPLPKSHLNRSLDLELWSLFLSKLNQRQKDQRTKIE